MSSIKASLLLLVLGAVFMQHQAEGFKVLAFYYGTWDVAHMSFVREANRWFPSVAGANGFEYESTTNWNRLTNDADMRNYDVIMFLDDKAQGNQRAGFQRYIESGGGFIGYHVSAFTTNNNEWGWYHNTFLGSQNFRDNTWKPTTAVLANEGGSHPATARLPEKFTSQANEWYAWSVDLRNNNNIQILLSIHPDSYPLGTTQVWRSGYYPVVWTNKNFNMMYVNMGHNDIDYANGNRDLSQTFEGEVQNRLIIDGLKWMAGRRHTFKVNQAQAEESPLMKAFAH